MNDRIDILISKTIKRKMNQLKEQKRISFSEQINVIMTSFSLLSIEKKADIIIKEYHQINTENLTRITILKKHIGEIEQLNKTFDLLKIKVPKLTFKHMIFFIIENHFKYKDKDVY